MILCISTSCSLASVAYLDQDGSVLASDALEAPRKASEGVLQMLEKLEQRLGLRPAEAHGFVADIGPGSFTGVKVAVTLAKAFGFAFEKQVAGISSFDLISTDATVVIPNVSGRFFVREQGQEGRLQEGLPTGSFVGYGKAIEHQSFPEAKNASLKMKELKWDVPEALVALYIAEPMISVPKQAYGSLVQPGGQG